MALPLLPIGLVLLAAAALGGGDGDGAPSSGPLSTPAGGGGPLPGDWTRYGGARPEVEGWPHQTILAVPGLGSKSPAVRAALLELARDSGIPVDSIATIIAHESGWNPAALYEAPDNAERVAAGKPPFYAAGLVQLTVSGKLPGFGTPEAVRAVAGWSAERQMAEVVRPLWMRTRKAAKGAHPGRALLLNFLPADADQVEDHVLADVVAWRRAVYLANKGLDVDKDGKILVSEVYDAAARTAKRAGGKRLNVEGQLVDGTPGQPTPQGAPGLAPGPYGDAVVAVARELLGVKETAPNDGPEIAAWAAELGLMPPLQWCAAFVSHCLREASKRTGVPMPVRGHGRAKGLLEQAAAGASLAQLAAAGRVARALSADVARASELPPGSLLVWDRSQPPGTGPQGHVAILESDEGSAWWTIEGNTEGADVRRLVRPKNDPRLVGAVLVGAPAAGPSLPSPMAPSPADPSRRVLVAGDSLAQGLTPPLAALLPRVHGFGVSGATVAGWSAATSSAAAPLLATLRPLDTVLLSLGANDIAGARSAEKVRAEVIELVERLEARGAVVGWIGPPALPWPGHGVRAVLAQECARLGVPLLDSEQVTFQRAQDGVHATSQGYATWAAAVSSWAKGSGLA